MIKPATLLILITLLLTMNLSAQSAQELADIWDKKHVTKLFPSDVRHKDLQKYLIQMKDLGLKVEEVGRSNGNREIYQVEFGRGLTKVFMWSQMHGDEPTATSALVDMFSFLQKNRSLPWVKTIEESLTIRAVPMLNPDGAEAYRRRNLQDIDINRDALNLATPEARLLKKLRDDWSPHIGFNLHNQNEMTTVGSTPKQAAISLLVVYGDAAKTSSPGHERNKRVAALIAGALNNFIPGHIGRYDDEFTATAFGDNFSGWGTPVILIETGALHGKDEMYLVKMNFIAFLTALNSIASGSEKSASPAAYESLPPNTSGRIVDVVFRNAAIVDPSRPDNAARANIGVRFERRRASFTPNNVVRFIGDANGLVGLEEYDAAGFYVVQKFGKLKVGEAAELHFYKDNKQIDWSSPNREKEFPPDAVYSLGKWVKGGKLISRK